ncbi:NUDIX domain-containing protein [Bradyrhizobium sp. B124]|uniref:NUDIX domain-containing protein n=1 Tax=Bradyrhizobium sp. B124 TaxID=3140245 RepID=UPI003183D57D
MRTVRATSLPKASAGILLFRRKDEGVEVLLGHPGGPFWKKKDLGAWTIPKGLIAFGEPPLEAAKREFAEGTGYTPRGAFVSLGDAKQPGGRTVHVWAAEDDWNPDELRSNPFEVEWPPRSGRQQSFPELDRAGWFGMPQAGDKILKGQAVFLDRLSEALR